MLPCAAALAAAALVRRARLRPPATTATTHGSNSDRNNNNNNNKNGGHGDAPALQEYTPPRALGIEYGDLARLAIVPVHRLRLAHLPTPLHRWNRAVDPENSAGFAGTVDLWIKRDDCTGCELSGNKVRKLEFLLADALARGFDSVVTVGGLQSNHTRATAAACARIGGGRRLRAHLVLRTTTDAAADRDPGVRGNLMVSRSVGARLHLVSADDYDSLGGGAACVRACADKLRRRDGLNPYCFPSGGSCPIGVWGYMHAVAEIVRQVEEGEEEQEQGQARRFDRIYFACGSGGTAAGLALGLHLCGWRARGTELVGIGVDDSPEFFYDKIDGLLRELGFESLEARDLLRIEDAVGLGYAQATPAELVAQQGIARRTGVVLDPVYSGKAALGMLRDLEGIDSARRKQRVLFVHTGGLLGLFDKAEQVQRVQVGVGWERLAASLKNDTPPSYVSCRDASPTLAGRRRYSFRDAIFSGWAEDGGMLVPQPVPRIPADKLAAWRAEAVAGTLSYPECCYRVLRYFVPAVDIPDATLRRIVIDDAFKGFGDASVVKEVDLSGVRLLELWHGPPLAFKDLGMQVLCKLLQHFLDKEGGGARLNLLVGTSGDTGSSAIEAAKDLDRVTITVLYPQGRGITRLQELQMTEEDGRNGVHVIGIEGTSDDLDRPMETVFGDVAFRKRHSIGSVNSVNICRVVVQVAHFVWAALRTPASEDIQHPNTVRFFVPTGAGGHVTAGVMAREMMADDPSGARPPELHVATNSNDVFHRILSTGSSGDQAGTVQPTVAPSMDIQIPYNLERLLWLSAMLAGGDEADKVRRCAEAARLMRSFKETARIELPEALRERIATVCGVSGSSCHDDAKVLAMIRAVHARNRYVLCPHTAIGVRAAMLDEAHAKGGEGSISRVCMACAHPAKFLAAVGKALALEGADARWGWASVEDRAHPSVGRLIVLDEAGREPVCESYKLGTDWTARLRAHFEAQTARQEMERL